MRTIHLAPTASVGSRTRRGGHNEGSIRTDVRPSRSPPGIVTGVLALALVFMAAAPASRSESNRPRAAVEESRRLTVQRLLSRGLWFEYDYDGDGSATSTTSR